jgi:hypothetical protein
MHYFWFIWSFIMANLIYVHGQKDILSVNDAGDFWMKD